MNNKLSAVLVSFSFLMGCSVQDDDAQEISKAEARQQMAGKADGIDWCAELGWYNDGICDDFCAEPDPDCNPSSLCADGTIVAGASNYVPSADGMECQMPTTHCLTNDLSACPLLSPLPPDFCSEGTIVAGEPSFISSADGKECEMPSVHCVTKDSQACPMFSPRPFDFCSEGTAIHTGYSYIASTDGMQCAIPNVHCLTNDASTCPQF